MKRFAAAMMVVIMLFTVAVPKQEAYADPITITALSAAAYTMAQAAGLNWVFTAGRAADVQTYMEDALTKWTVNNGGISIYGTTPVKAIAGKIAIAQQAYNALKNFINDFITDKSINSTSKQISQGYVGGVELGAWNEYFGVKESGFYCAYEPRSNAVQSNYNAGYYTADYNTGVFDVTAGFGQITSTVAKPIKQHSRYYKPIAWQVVYFGTNEWRYNIQFSYTDNETSQVTYIQQNILTNLANVSTPVTSMLSASIPTGTMDYSTVLTGEQWVADVGAAPDTNIEQLIPEVFSEVANNDLVISDEEVTTDTPSTPVPTSVPDTNIGQLIGSIDSTVMEISDALEGVGEQVGTISETLEGVGTGVGAISDALSVPSTAEAQSLKLPDLRTLFPFCIPFDLYNIISAFNVEPEAPHVQIPFNIPRIGLQYTFDLDFSDFNGVAQICRTMEFIAFAVGLAILTSKVIRW